MATNSARVNVEITTKTPFTSGLLQNVLALKFIEAFDLNVGTGDGQIDLCYTKSLSAQAAGTTSIDLHAGTIKDPAGNSAVFVEVCLIAIRNNSTVALANLTIGPDATAGFGNLGSPAAGLGFWPADIAADNDQGNVVAPNGDWLVLYCTKGVPVNNSFKNLDVVTTGAGSTNGFDLLVLGRSA